MTLRRLSMCADLLNTKYSNYTLLDIGCRTMDLKPLLSGCASYYGADMVPGENIIECDLEEGLAFDDNSIDVVVALDVLEHLDNIHQTFSEILRVGKQCAIISLPNMYYVSFRYEYLLGRGLGGKYVFPVDPPNDRHRWVLSYLEAVEFIRGNAASHTIETHMILPVRGRTKFISEPIEKLLGKAWPNLFAYGALFHIKLGS